MFGPLFALLLHASFVCSVPHRTFSCTIRNSSRSISFTESLLPEVSAEEIEVLLSFESIPDSTIVFMQATTRGLLYRSDDYGSTWSAVTLKGDVGLNSHGVARIVYIPSPGPNGVLYLLGNRGLDAHTASHGDLWISKDVGLSYRYQRIPSGVISLSVPAGEDSLATHFVVAIRHASLASPHSEVYLVRGFGARWTYLASAPKDGFHALVGRRLYLQRYSDDSNHKYRTELVYSDDLFATTSVTLGGLKNVWKSGSFKNENGDLSYFLVTCLDQSCSEKQIYFSRDDSLTLGRFYSSGVPESQWGIVQGEKFSVEDVNDSEIWIKIGLFPCNRVTCRSTLYRAHWEEVDSDGMTSRLTFMPILHNADFNSRLRAFPSLFGQFYQNQFLEHQDRVRTLVTYNRGNSWQFIHAEPPASKSGLHTGAVRETNPLVEKREHEARANLYLSATVPGLGSLIGNAGLHFSELASQPSTYLTTNGYDFRFVGEGKLAMASINGGSALVYVNTSQDTESEVEENSLARKKRERRELRPNDGTPIGSTGAFLYSLDGARTFHSCSLLEAPHSNSDRTEVFLQFVSIHELEIGGTIIVAWRITDNGSDTISTELALFRLDFQRAFDRQCEPDDLEAWSPLDSIGQCFMGQRAQYLRRLSGVVCLLDQNQTFLSPTQATACPCTMHDYACSRCFYSPPHVLDTGSRDLARPCTAACFTEGMKKYQPESCSAVGHESKFYEEEVGYKVIYNNSCIALELPKGRTMCGASFVVPARSIGVQAGRGVSYLLIAAMALCCLWRIVRFIKKRRSREVKERND